MKVTHQQALSKINAAIADGVEADWEEQVFAVVKYLGETNGEITHLRTAFDFAALVERHAGVKIDSEVAQAVLDIATA